MAALILKLVAVAAFVVCGYDLMFGQRRFAQKMLILAVFLAFCAGIALKPFG